MRECWPICCLSEFCQVSLEGVPVEITSQAHVVQQSANGGEDLPRRSRHIEIRVEWMRHKMSSGQVRSGMDSRSTESCSFGLCDCKE